MVRISVRVPSELVEAVDAWAVALGRTRSRVIRAVLEDALDSGQLPGVSPTSEEQLDAELQRLRELTST